MWTENEIFRADLESLCSCGYIPWGELNGKTVLITGGTGLIGYTVTSALAYRSLTRGEKIRLLLPVRSEGKARERYAAHLADGCEIRFLPGSVEDLPDPDGPVDYIIHGASPTASRRFTEYPAETARTILIGTENMLSLARRKAVSGMVFLSSMEVYGEITDRRVLREEDLGAVDLFSPRSVYPEGKRMAENLCCAYYSEYGVPVTAARLCQTFGPGVSAEDGSVFAYMARCALSGEDIRLSTPGTKENMYLYTADAAGAILLLLLRGKRGAAYSVGNPDTYCSVKEMGELVARTLGEGRMSVLTGTGDAAGIYPPDTYLRLDISRMRSLGWRPSVNLEEMFRRMTACF